MSLSSLPPRQTALYMIDEVTVEGALLPELINGGVLDHLRPEDKARAQRLATQTLRSADKADRMLSPFLQRRPSLQLRNILRLGTVEIWEGKSAAHGVVNDCVNLAGLSIKTAPAKGLVNAVLRRISEEREGAWDRLPTPRLPDWLRGPMIEAYGKPKVGDMEEAHFKGAPLDITAKGDAKAVAEALGGEMLPTGSIRIQNAGQVSAMPGFDAGDWWVQDAAAAIPVRLLNPQKGEKILDLCAAPGGKTMQIAASGAQVTALDNSKIRMEKVAQNLARTGLSATSVISDVFSYDQGGWDAILLDAPCSAIGTIRRHPDLPRAKDGSEFGALIEQQKHMIDHALGLLKAGGRLVFCTCSLLPDEGEVQVDEALERHTGLVVTRPDAQTLGIDPSWITQEGGIRLTPDLWADIGGMDGFYIACLTKPA